MNAIQDFMPALKTAAVAAVAALLLALPGAPAEAKDKLTLAVPGIPPVWAGLVGYVAKDAGFYDKYDLDVTIRPFASGAGAARAVGSGRMETSLSPTPVIVKMVSNAGVPLVGIQGLENPDWLMGSMDPNGSCRGMKGQGVGVDSVEGARYIQLRIVLRSCNLKTKDVKAVGLSSNVGAAMIAGQITYGILHLDDIPVIERQSGKKVKIVARVNEIAKNAHYVLLITTKKTLGEKRDALVRMVAAHIEAAKYMKNPANADKVARIAKITGRNHSDALVALKQFNDINFWPSETNGMSPKKIKITTKIQKKVGGIKKGKTPVPYSKLVDTSIWADAKRLTR